MTLLKWIVRVHKWAALIVGLQIVLWISGGVVMSVIAIEVVRGEHKTAEHGIASIDTQNMLPITDAAQVLGVSSLKSASLGEMLGVPVWRIEKESGELAIISTAIDAVSAIETQVTFCP